MSGIVLLLGMWTAKRTGLVMNMEKEVQDVRNCVKFIRSGEEKWPTARRLMYVPAFPRLFLSGPDASSSRPALP